MKPILNKWQFAIKIKPDPMQNQDLLFLFKRYHLAIFFLKFISLSSKLELEGRLFYEINKEDYKGFAMFKVINPILRDVILHRFDFYITEKFTLTFYFPKMIKFYREVDNE